MSENIRKLDEFIREERASEDIDNHVYKERKYMSFKDILPSKIPQGWKIVRLKHIAKRFITGGTPSTKEPKFWNGDIPSPFYARYSWHVHYRLDKMAMKQAAEILLGLHDFTSFQGVGSVCHTSEREVKRSTLVGHPRRWFVFTIEASAFLRHMVRNIVGTLIEVGRGSMSIDEFRDVLEARDRSVAGITAPPQGLFLKEVKY